MGRGSEDLNPALMGRRIEKYRGRHSKRTRSSEEWKDTRQQTPQRGICSDGASGPDLKGIDGVVEGALEDHQEAPAEKERAETGSSRSEDGCQLTQLSILGERNANLENTYPTQEISLLDVQPNRNRPAGKRNAPSIIGGRRASGKGRPPFSLTLRM